jgi:membrane associated rhomboid family serine protease
MNSLSISPATLIFAVTLGLSLFGLYQKPELIGRLVLRPYRVARGKDIETVVTSGFVHGDLGHLLFNMVTFYFFCFPMERFIGGTRFLVLYALGLVLSSVCSIVKEKDNPGYATLGASGAISAVLFAYIIYFPLSTLLIFPIPFPIPAFLFAIGYLAYSMWAAKQGRDNINHDAHLCGAITGVAFVLVTDPKALAGMLGAF